MLFIGCSGASSRLAGKQWKPSSSRFHPTSSQQLTATGCFKVLLVSGGAIWVPHPPHVPPLLEDCAVSQGCLLVIRPQVKQEQGGTPTEHPFLPSPQGKNHTNEDLLNFYLYKIFIKFLAVISVVQLVVYQSSQALKGCWFNPPPSLKN